VTEQKKWRDLQMSGAFCQRWKLLAQVFSLFSIVKLEHQSGELEGQNGLLKLLATFAQLIC
jgi:hypothetical protein